MINKPDSFRTQARRRACEHGVSCLYAHVAPQLHSSAPSEEGRRGGGERGGRGGGGETYGVQGQVKFVEMRDKR
jgi:hypothetical protein